MAKSPSNPNRPVHVAQNAAFKLAQKAWGTGTAEDHAAAAKAHSDTAQMARSEGSHSMAASHERMGADHAKLAKEKGSKPESKGAKLKAFAEQGKKPGKNTKGLQKSADDASTKAAHGNTPELHQAAQQLHKEAAAATAKDAPGDSSFHARQAGFHEAASKRKIADNTRIARQDRNLGTVKKAGAVQTSAKGAKYYVNASGNKVYVK